jgi:PBP1b-binding outer membrane lipoprotein LpoB
MHTLRTLLVVTFSAVLLTGCFASQSENTRIQQAVAALPTPSSWAEVGSIETTCTDTNVDCQDPNARRLFLHEGTAAEACAQAVDYVNGTPAFVSATAIRGAAEVQPSAADCQAELTAYTRYQLRATAPSDVGGAAAWRLRLTPADAGGFELSVVLGDPPRDPWPA